MKQATTPLQRGASLIELVVTLGIVAGALRVGFPAMDEIIQSNGLRSASAELLDDLHLARTEAVKRNRRVALCKSADGLQCVAGGGWEQGWIVFHDENNNGVVDRGEELIAVHAAFPGKLRVSGNQPVANYISFTSLGASKLTDGGFQAGTLTLCLASGTPTQSRQVILNSVGRPRVQKATVPACV